jgi:putative oxidoreductase
VSGLGDIGPFLHHSDYFASTTGVVHLFNRCCFNVIRRKTRTGWHSIFEENSMKLAATIARYLLGLIFTVFGLNGFLHFLPMGSPPPPLAAQFFGALVQSHYMAVIFGLQLVCGLLLLVNRYVPLALTILGAILFNILSFHIFMAPSGLPLAAFTTLLWAVVAWRARSVFVPLLQNSYETPALSKENGRGVRSVA